ncbi:unnamed protein product [Adineta steineri]|uniref:F-box domain-containing protein n=1 Tax=Adineta steineri TaxID=433720 RepID=A0A814AT64_9BILA|nr:unnamed protein product [Adineta steineri]CAF0981260.1 unnamed protein product [Adineta steineri]
MDLPDEMIIKIWNNLNNIDVLYSFVGVNKRFDKLVRALVYTRSIQLAEKDSKTNKYCPLPDLIIDRYCLDILPQIHQYIECLILEPFSIERILLSTMYPRLHKLIFTKINTDFVLHHFTEESPLVNIFKNNITHLILTIDRKGSTSSSRIDLREILLPRIFHTFTNLIELDFNQNSIEGRPLISLYTLSSMIYYSASLAGLSISVKSFNDCLCILDGRFSQLHKLYVIIDQINTPSLSIENLTAVTHLKCFSLCSYSETNEYNSYILPLIHQMIYLEELELCLDVSHRSTFIDGTHLKNEILIYLPRLQIFMFNIKTHSKSMSNYMYMQSNNDISRTFLNWQYGRVNCYISHYPDNAAQCHIFSLPCNMTYIYMISYGFQGDVCKNVRILYLSDREYPFKHEFFLRIARAFPFITHLTVLNNRIINNTDESNDQLTSVVEFHHLISLSIRFQRAIYVEQFLVDTNTYLPNLIDLKISYNNLVTVTNNFTRDVTRRNCSNVQNLSFTIRTITAHAKDFYLYFPCLKDIC